jgi:hypothetical protein
MQPTPRPNLKTQAQKIFIVALTLFAVAGLLVGFTFGKVNKQAKIATPTLTQQPHTQPTTTSAPTTIAPTATVDVAKVGLGCPEIQKIEASEKADDSTAYTVIAQVMDKSVENKDACGKGKPLSAPGIMCKIWLTQEQDADILSTLHQDKDALETLKSGTFQKPFPKEVPNAFVFDETTPQAQQCGQGSPITWKYKLSSTLKPGNYFLSVISNWKGQQYKWWNVAIKIKNS